MPRQYPTRQEIPRLLKQAREAPGCGGTYKQFVDKMQRKWDEEGLTENEIRGLMRIVEYKGDYQEWNDPATITKSPSERS